MLIFPKLYASLHCFFSIADLITWKMKQGLMIQSLPPNASSYKNELSPDTELELQKVGFSQIK